MKSLRNWGVPLLGITALTALFLKLPEIPNIFGLFACKTCAGNDPFLPLIGAGYFAGVVAASLLFPAFPKQRLARGGLLWAILLALILTYLHLPSWCGVCLIAHACNILIWAIWVLIPAPEPERSDPRIKLFLLFLAPVSVIALFSCMNLTFMAYGFKNHRNQSAISLKIGDAVPAFIAETTAGRSLANNERMILNFISPDCPHSREQLKVLNGLQSAIHTRVIHVSPYLAPELMKDSPAEWVEDKEYRLRKLFKVKGYPTLFALEKDGKIAQVIPGVSKRLETDLLARFETE